MAAYRVHQCACWLLSDFCVVLEYHATDAQMTRSSSIMERLLDGREAFP